MTPLQNQFSEYSRLKAEANAASDIPIDLTLSIYEFLFLGPLYFGTPVQEASWSPGTPQFIYDTDANYVAVSSTACGDDCIQQYYDPDNSSSYQPVEAPEKDISFSTPMFAGDVLTVDTVKDNVCLDLAGTQCVEQFQFYEILEEQVDSIIEDISGILGFKKGTSEQPSYLDELYATGLIDAPVLTMNLNTAEGQKSTVTFGTADLSNAATGDTGTIKAADTTTSIQIGTTDGNSYTDQSFTISTGSAFIYLTEAMVETLQSELDTNVWSCSNYGCESTSACKDATIDMPDLKFDMKGSNGDDISIELPGIAYTWEYVVGNQ